MAKRKTLSQKKAEGQAPKINGYSHKWKAGVEVNHSNHPKNGVPWCKLCQDEGRGDQ